MPDTPKELPPPDLVARSLVEVIRTALLRGEAARLPGLGTFSVEHRPSAILENAEGQLHMQPPRDEVIFTPES